MSRRIVLGVALFAAMFVATVAAQDPLIVVPSAYRLEFENEWVKVVRVTYGPKAVIAPHFHTERASAYVYLNDGGPVLFKHEGLPYAGVTRPATRAGSFRVYKGIQEVHSVENPTDTPSEFLRVEFKTQPVDEASLRGKFFREEPAPTAAMQRVQFENAQIRITRIYIPPGETLAMTAPATEPALLVVLTRTGITAAGEVEPRQLDAGKSAWLQSGQDATLRAGTSAGELLRFEFKTSPTTVLKPPSW